MTSFAHDSLRLAAALIARAGAGPAWTALVLLVLVGSTAVGEVAAAAEIRGTVAVEAVEHNHAAPRSCVFALALPAAGAPAPRRGPNGSERRARVRSDYTLPLTRAP